MQCDPFQAIFEAENIEYYPRFARDSFRILTLVRDAKGRAK